jgi:hypothetical protein
MLVGIQRPQQTQQAQRLLPNTSSSVDSISRWDLVDVIMFLSSVRMDLHYFGKPDPDLH